MVQAQIVNKQGRDYMRWQATIYQLDLSDISHRTLDLVYYCLYDFTVSQYSASVSVVT